MKNIKIFFLATVAIVAGLFTACNDSDFEAGPAADGAQVYFPDYTPTTYSISDDVTSIAIPVKRIVKDAAMTVAILPAEESGLFTIPTSVSFAAGSDTAELLITFDRTALEDGKEYPIALLINDEDNTTTYGYRTLNFTVAPWPWEQMKGTGLFREGWLGDVFSGNLFEIEVNVHKHKSQAGIYMVEEMFGWPYLTEFFGATEAQLSAQFSYTPSNIVIDCSDPAQVTIESQWSGITENSNGYGEFMIASSAPGTLVNGIITFPNDGLSAELVGLGRTFAVNTGGTFRIVLPGFEVVDYALTAAYGGMKVSADGETTSAIVDFKYGADVTNIHYVIAENELTEAQIATLAAAIADESAENINTFNKFEVGGKEVSAEVELSTPGTYTVVAVPLDKEKKPVVGEASAASFYFPGMAGSTPNDIAVALYKVSEYPEAAEFAAANPDYSSVLFEISGTEMKSIKTYFNKTSVIENIEIESGGMTLQEVMNQLGQELDAAAMEELATTGKYWNIGIKIPSDTYFTMVVEATNAYGKTKLIKSEPFKTTVPPYNGELVIGEYDMSFAADEENTFENLFAVVPTVGSETEFFVKDFAIENDTQWYATYDSAKSTLTMSGVQLGREDKGNLFSYFTNYLTPDKSIGYGIYSFADENSKEGDDPIVLTIDPASKQISGLATYIVEVPVADFGANEIIGAIAVYHADGTVITKHSGAQSSAPAAKVKGVRTRVPFSSVRVPVSFRKSLGNRDLLMNVNMMKSTNAKRHGVRTLSVKTAQCEPLPKQIGRRISIKENADRNLR